MMGSLVALYAVLAGLTFYRGLLVLFQSGSVWARWSRTIEYWLLMAAFIWFGWATLPGMNEQRAILRIIFGAYGILLAGQIVWFWQRQTRRHVWR